MYDGAYIREWELDCWAGAADRTKELLNRYHEGDKEVSICDGKCLIRAPWDRKPAYEMAHLRLACPDCKEQHIMGWQKGFYQAALIGVHQSG